MDKYRVLFTLASVLFLACLLMVFIVDFLSAEFYIMLISLIINLFLVIYASLRIRKKAKKGE